MHTMRYNKPLNKHKYYVVSLLQHGKLYPEVLLIKLYKSQVSCSRSLEYISGNNLLFLLE